MVESRLGAMFTIALPFMLAIFAVRTFGTNNLLVTEGLVPAITLKNEINVTNTVQFKSINITLTTYTPSVESCQAIKLDSTKANGLTHCNKTYDQQDWDSAATFCRLNLMCHVSGSIRGTNTLSIEFPDAFQNIEWSVRTSTWNSTDEQQIMEGLTSSFGPDSKKSLVGTKEKPTTLSFGVVRSKFIDNFQKKITDLKYYYIQLSYLGLTKEDNDKGTDGGKHYVAFVFDVEESVFVKEHAERVELIARLATMFTLLLSAMGLMRMFKTYLELTIDKCCMKFTKNKRDIPEDILRRQKILEEFLLTDKGKRRLSSVRNLIERMEDENGTDSDDDESEVEEEVVDIGGGAS